MALNSLQQPRQPRVGRLPTRKPIQCRALSNLGDLGNALELLIRIKQKQSSYLPYSTIWFRVDCWLGCLNPGAAWVAAPLWLPSRLPSTLPGRRRHLGWLIHRRPGGPYKGPKDRLNPWAVPIAHYAADTT